MVNLFLDDIRNPPNDREWTVVRSYEEAVNHVITNGVPHFISFDHDLGHNVPTGHDFSKWLVDMHLDGRYTFPKDFDFNVHSANPPGLANIKGLMDGFIHFLKNSE